MEGRREELDRAFRPALARRVLEPRGHDALVGALLTPPVSRGAAAGVVFFDNVGPALDVRPRHDRRRAHARAPRPHRAGLGAARHAGRDRSARSSPSTASSRSRTCPRACHARDVAVEVPGHRARRRRRRLRRQLVLPGRAARRGRRARQPRAAAHGDARDPAGPGRRRASPAQAGSSSTTSSCMGPPARAGRGQPELRDVSRAAPTTARPAGPAPRRRWRRSTPAASSRSAPR